MRASTPIHAAIRNIGDSQDTGKHFQGTLGEAVLWLASQLTQTSMATRIVIGLGRNQRDAMLGVDVKGAGMSAVNSDLMRELESLMGAEPPAADNEPDLNPSAMTVDGDDYLP